MLRFELLEKGGCRVLYFFMGLIVCSEVKFVYVGDARNNMGNSLMIGCAKLGLNFCFLAPKKLWPEDSLLRYARNEAERSRGIIQCFEISQKAEAMKVGRACWRGAHCCLR